MDVFELYRSMQQIHMRGKQLSFGPSKHMLFTFGEPPVSHGKFFSP
jgi:hypothetical protein